MKLPESNNINIPVEKLSGVFNDTTNSYKFYWFLSLIENFKDSSSENLLVDDIIIEMICKVWYPINYFKLSFGKQDRFQSSIEELQEVLGCPKDITKRELKQILNTNKNNSTIKKIINDLSRYVPFRFLSPWFVNDLKGELDVKKNNLIRNLSNKNDSKCLYKIKSLSEIEINSLWKNYLLKNLNILEGFTYWNLVNYLQRNNPNVPNIPNKLFPPQVRLLSDAKKFWEIYFKRKNNVNCIFSSELISINNFSIDHFIPWSFVTHDQLWNLLPIPKSVNSSKGDNLPNEKYFEKFYELQFDAFHVVLENGIIKDKTLEDYTILFKDSISNILNMDKNTFKKNLDNNIKPLIQIATNMGFPNNWTYKK